MRAVIQRVLDCSVTVEGTLRSKIGQGIMVLVGIEDADTMEDINWLAGKIINMRIFDDENGVMNRSVMDIQGNIMIVSQFTLMAQTRKGNRPSYIRASGAEFSKPMYEKFCETVEKESGIRVQRGIFGADMKIAMTGDGPVTIIMDTKNRE
ncbi:MAG: D-aminoacyl-tRNA deacylase [Bacteroidaceae bacterium]|nr:D-aminoacyl-tRNA deacylase [Bacteroidaceae bacterium]